MTTLSLRIREFKCDRALRYWDSQNQRAYLLEMSNFNPLYFLYQYPFSFSLRFLVVFFIFFNTFPFESISPYKTL